MGGKKGDSAPSILSLYIVILSVERRACPSLHAQDDTHSRFFSLVVGGPQGPWSAQHDRLHVSAIVRTLPAAPGHAGPGWLGSAGG